LYCITKHPKAHSTQIVASCKFKPIKLTKAIFVVINVQFFFLNKKKEFVCNKLLLFYFLFLYLNMEAKKELRNLNQLAWEKGKGKTNIIL
jgi:hypothetical protein